MLDSGFELFVESPSAVLVEAHVAAGALVASVALLGSGEAAGEMGGEASGVLYRPSQPYHPVDFEGGLLRGMPTPPPGQIQPHPTDVGSRPGPRGSPGLVVVSLRSPPLAPPGGWATSHNPLFRGDSFSRSVARRARSRRSLTRGGCIGRLVGDETTP